MSSYNRFGYEWSKYSRIIPLYEHQFLGWIQPLTPADFKGLRVLDGGCGIGRNSLWSAKYGASQVVAFDVDPRSVGVARNNLAPYANAKVEEHSLYDIPYENEFDLTRLPHPVVVEAHKVGGLAEETGEQHLIALKSPAESLEKAVEIALHQSPPPNTSTSRKRQAGLAWPTAIN